MNQVTVQSEVSCFQLGPSAAAASEFSASVSASASGASCVSVSLLSGAAGASSGFDAVSSLPPQPLKSDSPTAITNNSEIHFFLFIFFLLDLCFVYGVTGISL